MGNPYGTGGIYRESKIKIHPEPKNGYRFVNLRATNLRFYDVEWNEEEETYYYEFGSPEGAATIYLYYEPKDYTITLDERLAEYITIQPYADEGEKVLIYISEDNPYDLGVLFEDGSIEELKPKRMFNDILGFRMYGKSIKLVPIPLDGVFNTDGSNETVESANKTNVLVPIAVVGVVGVAGFLGVSYYKKKK